MKLHQKHAANLTTHHSLEFARLISAIVAYGKHYPIRAKKILDKIEDLAMLSDFQAEQVDAVMTEARQSFYQGN